MSRLTLNQIATRITAPLQDLLPIDNVALQERLKSRATLAPFLDALAIEPSPLRRELEELITLFTRHQSDLVRGYLDSDIPLSAMAQALIRFLVESGSDSNLTEIMASLAPIDQRVDRAINSHLPSQCERFALCGYGLGNGEYERNLAARLAEQGTTVKLFGYDPTNACFDRETIQPCSLATLKAETCPLFDMVLTRWVLHHVTPDQRWDALVACVRRCKPGGSLLIVEDGAFSTDKNRAVLLYELLLGFTDVLVNSVLYPDWLRAGSHPGERFFLRHLTLADITALESVFPTPTKRHVEWVQAGFFPQILIRYTLGTPVSAAV